MAAFIDAFKKKKKLDRLHKSSHIVTYVPGKNSLKFPLSSSFSYKYLPSILLYPKEYKIPAAEAELINFPPLPVPAQLLPFFLDLKTLKAGGIYSALCLYST